MILVLTAGGVRLLPEIVAYPYPIGYDVINYYLPVLSNFENHWKIVSNQYPFYVLILYLIINVTKLNPQFIISSSAVVLYILFSISVYQLSRLLFKFNGPRSLFLTLFVIFQLSLMRTSWDLHKDMLSLTAMFFAISLVFTNRRLTKRLFVLGLFFCIVSVLTDRMIGLLLVGTLIIYASLVRRRIELTLAIVTSAFFLVSLLQSTQQIEQSILGYPEIASLDRYLPVNLFILSLVTTGIILPFGIFGFLRSQNIILKIPVLISLIGSLSWLLHPVGFLFLPDRWIFIFSVLISIFAGYGINIFISNVSLCEPRRQTFYLFILLVPFAILGVLFATTSGDAPISIPAAFHDYVGQFGPTTMQSNSISIQESKSIMSAIGWINSNTPGDSNLVIDKHWRGWTELELKNRSFLFYEDLDKLEVQRKSFYLLILTKASVPQIEDARVLLVYENNNFLLYRISFDN
jgi:hypothetical protein